MQNETIINISDKSSLAISSGLLGYLSAHEHEISVILTIGTFLCGFISMAVSVYLKLKQNKREEIKQQQDSILFNERRSPEHIDDGHRRRETDK